ncbi:MAG: 23S rRNA (adenine(2503)-C(2))-methyltransferase RlmN, partial [Candidatus Acidiferrales bacterium]
MIELLGLTLDQLRQQAVAWDLPAYCGNQLYHALYVERRWQFDQMTNLSRTLRERLLREASVTLPGIEKRYPSADGSVRYVLRLAPDTNAEARKSPAERGRVLELSESPTNKSSPEGVLGTRSSATTIETIWMPEADRQTLCLSSQAGCAVDCHFCATAQLGLIRNLTAGEIVGQVLTVLDAHRQELRPQTNVVLMGQGEPLLNYEETLQAVRLLADPEGMHIPLRKITLSTAGIVPGIRRLAQEEIRPKLAVSLNATTDEQRDAIMPLNRKYPLAELLAACRDYPLRPWERLTFEYVLLGGFNDTAADARRLVALIRGLRS